MSISIHIPFYNPNPEKKEGHRNLRRFDYLKENIENLKTLSIKNDIFVHTHNEFLDDKKLDARIIKHQISDYDLDKGYLTWKCRSLMEEQKNDYEYFCYLEHDIKFSEHNLQYWLKYQDQLDKKNYGIEGWVYLGDVKLGTNLTEKPNDLRANIGLLISIIFYFYLIYFSYKDKIYRKFYLAPIIGIILLGINSLGYPSPNFNPLKADTFKTFYYVFILAIAFAFITANC